MNLLLRGMTQAHTVVVLGCQVMSQLGALIQYIILLMCHHRHVLQHSSFVFNNHVLVSIHQVRKKDINRKKFEEKMSQILSFVFLKYLNYLKTGSTTCLLK